MYSAKFNKFIRKALNTPLHSLGRSFMGSFTQDFHALVFPQSSVNYFAPIVWAV